MALARGNNFLITQTLPNPRLPHRRHTGLTAMLFRLAVSGDSIHTVSTLGPAEPTQPYVAVLRESARNKFNCLSPARPSPLITRGARGKNVEGSLSYQD